MNGLGLREELARYGATAEEIKLFERPNPEHLRYLDLIARNEKPVAGPLPSGVVEYGDRPLLYVLSADTLASDPTVSANEVRRLVRTLACRGEGAFLGVIRPGQLDLYPIALTRAVPHAWAVHAYDPRSPMLVHDLASGLAQPLGKQTHEAKVRAEAIHNLLFELLTNVTEALKRGNALSCTPTNDQILPLVGRVLFTRFLIDRGIINERTFREIYRDSNPDQCFSTPDLAALTCKWLDDKFNGELLPLADCQYKKFFQTLHRKDDKALAELSYIMHRAPGGQLSFDLYWDGIDFAHVPVGLLSEVYEDYAHKFFLHDARKESIRFTPRHLAEYTVNQAFLGLAPASRHKAKILDPAAGAGVFLVLSFQRLVAERWSATKKRPETAEIREILQEQICGFDINRSAMTLAALSLYLTALEVDPNPYPPEKLRFKQLLGSVLFNMREPNEAYPHNKPILGSLGPLGLNPAHIGVYDIVIGNPPWTAWSGSQGRHLSNTITQAVREIARGRDQNGLLGSIANGYEHNDMVPDVPFAWRAMQWAKPSGIIALILHARILFKRSDKGANMRDALFRCLRITGVLNGAELMSLWPHLNQPFCILFARNEVPMKRSAFYAITPELDSGPSSAFQMRIDAEAANPVQLEVLINKPFLLKTLYRGGRFDVDLITRMNATTSPAIERIANGESDDEEIEGQATGRPLAVRLGKYWASKGLNSGQGFNPGGAASTSKLRLLNGKLLTTHDGVGLRVTTNHLEDFNVTGVRRARNPEIYQPPLVLISEGQGESRENIRARIYLGKRPLIFNRSFYGFSAAGHSNAEDLSKYLFALISSDVFIYYVLQTSAKFGVERRTILVEDVEDFPIIPFESLDQRQLEELHSLVENLSLDHRETWTHLNRWVAKLYDLSATDQHVIEDTLTTRMPFRASIDRSLAPANAAEKKSFLMSVQKTLAPFFDEPEESIHVLPVPIPVPTWLIFDVCTNPKAKNGNDILLRLALSLAKNHGATRVMQEISEGHLRIAVRNQYRYLTSTRGRLCALDILRDKGKLFPLKAATA